MNTLCPDRPTVKTFLLLCRHCYRILSRVYSEERCQYVRFYYAAPKQYAARTQRPRKNRPYAIEFSLSFSLVLILGTKKLSTYQTTIIAATNFANPTAKALRICQLPKTVITIAAKAIKISGKNVFIAVIVFPFIV